MTIKEWGIRIASGLVVLTLVACAGDDSGNDNGAKDAASTGPAEGITGLTSQSESDLPTCADSNDGALAYVKDPGSFYICSEGDWSQIDLAGKDGADGKDGEKGADGVDGKDLTLAAQTLAAQYRKSIFRVRLQCDCDDSNTAECDTSMADSVTNPHQLVYRGSGFYCAEGAACTNIHVISCPAGYAVGQLDMQQVDDDWNTVNPQAGTALDPFYSSTTPTIAEHASKDLARITIEAADIPEGVEVLPISAEPFTASVEVLTPIMAMSFPLGLEDMYTDIGSVITPLIGHCTPGIGYNCPGGAYDFAVSNDTDHGSSGSPLINIDTGEVVGVTTAGTEGENANYTWAVDASLISEIP